MGNTCSSVHIALTGTTADAIEGIARAYTMLGFERAQTASPEGGKHLILLRKEGDAFLSVYDSDNAALDTGELKQLALAASKIFKTAAVCTSLYDSDTFEVVVFNAGKQVDLVMTDPEQYSGPLKILTAASRAKQWSKVFGKSLNVEQITQAIATTSAFADDAVAELSRLIGLTGGQSQLHYQDLREEEAFTHHLHFTRQPSALRAAPESQIALRNYFDPDNSRMLLVNPASWPVPPREPILVTWLMLSEGAGFDDGTLAIRVTGPNGLAITHGYMDGAKCRQDTKDSARFSISARQDVAQAVRRCEQLSDRSGDPFSKRCGISDSGSRAADRHGTTSRAVARALRAAIGQHVEHNARPAVRASTCRQHGSRVQLGAQSRRLLRVSGHLDWRMKERVDDFAARHPVLQAWHSQCTWQPLFDHAYDYHRTVYEDHSVLNWFRGILQTDSGLDASKMSLQWCRNVLRMVTPHMWICRALLEQIDRAALEAVAQVTETNDVFKIALREGRRLDDLEFALLPVLPVESARVHSVG